MRYKLRSELSENIGFSNLVRLTPLAAHRSDLISRRMKLSPLAGLLSLYPVTGVGAGLLPAGRH
jgi:hypothetical protein